MMKDLLCVIWFCILICLKEKHGVHKWLRPMFEAGFCLHFYWLNWASLFCAIFFVESLFIFINCLIQPLYCCWSNDSTNVNTSFAGRSAPRPAARSPPPKPGIDFYVRIVAKELATFILGFKYLCACIFSVGLMGLFFLFSFLVLMLLC